MDELHKKLLGIGIFHLLKDRLSRRRDTELEQALVRILVASCFLLYFSNVYNYFLHSGLNINLIQIVVGIYFLLGIGIIGWIIVYPEPLELRRITGIIGDNIIVTGLLVVTGQMGMPAIIVYPIIVMGSAFHYGIKYLIIGALCSTIGMFVVLVFGHLPSSGITIVVGAIVFMIVVFAFGYFFLIKENLAKHRPDSEHEQALIRIVITAIIFLYLWISLRNKDTSDIVYAAIIAGAGFVVSNILFCTVVASTRKSLIRRIIGMLVDLGGTSAALLWAGEAGTPLIAVYLWVTMGNGFRYGISYLFISAVLSFTGFSLVFLFGEFWSSHPVISTSILIILLALPLYMASLLEKLNDAINKANEANKAKSQFLANMSHELRTPLNGVIGMSDLLMDTKLNEEQQDLARTIQSSAHTLLELIENVLDISRIEAGKIAILPEDFDLHALVKNVETMFEAQVRKKGLSINSHVSLETPFQLNGDAQHLKQVLINLMGNAIKFTDKGSVDIKVMPVKFENETVVIRFEVLDTGIGIPKEAQARIFDRFSQADTSTTRKYGGTGLGTTIAKQLVESMDGRIGFESGEGIGTVFWVELAFKYQPITNVSSEMPGLFANGRALVFAGHETANMVLDCIGSWGMLGERSESLGLFFSSLYETDEYDRAYDFLIVERKKLNIPVGNFIEIIRGEGDFKRMPVVLIDDGASDTEDQLLKAGYSSVLYAPVNKSLLFNALHVAKIEVSQSDNIVSLADHFKERSASKLKILVAEDNPTNQQVIKSILERAKHEPYLVDDGDKALDMLKRECFDLIILDMNMPVISGIDVLKMYRFMDTSATTPVIILTADATLDALKACEEAGADRYLTKPVNARKLLDCIAELVANSEGKHWLEKQRQIVNVKPKFVHGFESSQMIRRFSNELLNESVLDNLMALGSGVVFVSDLITHFAENSRGLCKEIRSAQSARDYPRYRDAVHALKGSAGDLGAYALMNSCLKAEQLKPYEIGSPDMQKMIDKLDFLIERTCLAFAAYLDKTRSPANESSTTQE